MISNEIKKLQDRATDDVVSLLIKNKDVTLKAPTGSGKTYIIANVVNKILEIDQNYVFIVSSLSKGELALQNHERFIEYKSNLIHLKPYYIDTEITTEESLYIPTSYNLYSLGRDKFKKKTLLMEQNVLKNFLFKLKNDKKKIIWVRDECHQDTNNLNELKDEFFTCCFNLSATPKNKEEINCEITDEEAVNVNLIKRVEYDENERDFNKILNRFRELRKIYAKWVNFKPLLIVQISNKSKGKEEFEKLKTVLNINKDLQWVYITDNPTTSEHNCKFFVNKPFHIWKNQVKTEPTIDIVIFKMVFTEGYDIPRACMLFQVRNTEVETLTEQVIGRVRRNPILKEWNNYTKDAQNNLTMAYVYARVPKTARKFKKVILKPNHNFNVKSTYLKSLNKQINFDLDTFLKEKTDVNNKEHKLVEYNPSIFELYDDWKNVMDETKSMCWDNIKDNSKKWFLVSENIKEINTRAHSFLANYEDSMSIYEEEVNLPDFSSYEFLDQTTLEINDWIWSQEHNGKIDHKYSFDSEAERKFAILLKNACERSKINLWGKNFYTNSNICYEYCLDQTHKSYPDFIVKDKKGRIHIFEVKSINKTKNKDLNEKEYKEKIIELSKCYQQASKLTHHIFYLPILKNDSFDIHVFDNGEVKNIYEDEIRSVLNQE